ncbi:MAG: LacI family transcriptional regulator, partial [Xanthomonadaceae bacterium]|nr:LacI family transcriptional regulator [Xanthomonadaceae bacterium]
MRKVSGVLALVCAAMLAGCGGGGSGAGEGAITVGFSQVGAESEWRTANT